MSEPITSTTPHAQHEQDGISPLDVLIVLAKHKKLVLGLPFFVAVIAAGVSLLLPSIFTGTTKILPPQQSQSNAVAILGQLGAVGGVASSALGLKNPSDIFVTILKSRTVADKIVNRFDLRTAYEVKLQVDARSSLAKDTSITAAKDGVITIQVDDLDPIRAAAIANAYVEELEQLTLTLAVSEASQRRMFFEEQLKSTNRNLARAQEELKKYQESTGIVSEGLLGLSATTSASLRAQVTAKEVQLSAMRAFATERNPELIRAESELASYRAQLARIENSQGKRTGGVVVGVEKVPAAVMEYLNKARDVRYHDSLYEAVSRMYETARLDEAKNATLIQVLDKAVAPEKKSRPLRRVIVLISFLSALVATVVLIFVIEAISRASSDPQQSKRLQVLRGFLAWNSGANNR